MQSSVFAGPSDVAPTPPVAGGTGSSNIALTIPVDAPLHQETKEAFAEVSSAFQEIPAKHGQIQEGVCALASCDGP